LSFHENTENGQRQAATVTAIKLARRLGLFDATMIVMGGIIGSGIFMNSYVVARQVHTPFLILGAWLTGGLIALAELDSNLPTYFAGTPARLHDEILGVNRLTATLFTIFGAVAFMLSAVGLYGVMSFSVNQRTQEFGIRMALGADAMRILRMVMSQGAWQLAIGLVLGVGGIALLLGVVAAAPLSNILFKINPLDPTIYLLVSGLLTFVAAASCFVPARRATRVNPMEALRTE